MLTRIQIDEIRQLLALFPAVAILGPRQVGKTTLAKKIAAERDSVYLDLESERDLVKINNPISYFAQHQDKLIVLDEIQRAPKLFQELRGIIDDNRASGRKSGQFLILGSASIELLKQSGESLAGRLAYCELAPISVEEFDDEIDTLWLRGGFPESLLAIDVRNSLLWRQNFIRTYLERDIPQLGPRIPAETLRRFWIMLAHLQGTLFNASALANSLGVTSKTTASYLDLMVDLLLVRRLEPYTANLGKRLIKSPKIYVRDSGLTHALLGIKSMDELLSHPVIGMSWEGFVIENILNSIDLNVFQPFFYRTSTGVEMDLILEKSPTERIAIEIKRSISPKISRGLRQAISDLNPTETFVVCPINESFLLDENIHAIGIYELISQFKK